MKYIVAIIVNLSYLLVFKSLLISETIQVAIISSSNVVQYTSVVASFKERIEEEMNKGGNKVISDYYDIKKGSLTLQNKVYDLVYAVGAQAVKLAVGKIKGRPLVFSMILNPEENAVVQLEGDSIVTGVSLDLSPKMQLELFKKIMPDLNTVGLFYSEQNAVFAEEAVKAGKELSLVIRTFKLNTDVEVVQTLKSSIETIDALWLIPDTVVCTKDSMVYILKYSLEKKKAVIGFAEYLSKAGALFSCINDYEDNGRQAAELAIRIFNNESGKVLSVRKPKKINYVINLRIAQMIGRNIPEKVLSEAKEVYR